MAEDKHPLVGRIVYWFEGGRRGKVIAALPDDQILVEYIARPGASDPPPPHMLVLPTYMEPPYELTVFDTVEAEQAWFEWLIADDERRVVSLVPPPKKPAPKKPPPKK
jgi:hypothetical protein